MQPGIASAFTEDPIAAAETDRSADLIIGGGRDLQMARLDFAALSAASPAAKTLWLPDMNHVLVDVTDEADNLAAYNQPERALDTALIDSVAAFILAERRALIATQRLGALQAPRPSTAAAPRRLVPRPAG